MRQCVNRVSGAAIVRGHPVPRRTPAKGIDLTSDHPCVRAGSGQASNAGTGRSGGKATTTTATSAGRVRNAGTAPEAPAATVTGPASGEQGLFRRLRDKLNSGEPLKSLTLILTALIAFFFGIAKNQMSDYVKRADNCYIALFTFNSNIV